MKSRFLVKVTAIIMLLILLVSPMVSFATKTNTNQEEEKEDMFQNGKTIIGAYDTGIGNSTIDEVSAWGEKKLYEVIYLIQKWSQPFSIVMFIIFLIVTLIGVFGNGKSVSSGIIGMIVTLIVYVAILYAPDILDKFLMWART